MNWFEDWFDSPLYEKLYANRNEQEAAELADLIEKLLPMEKYRKVLDLGCGRGRHSLTLAERGYRVTGIDLSEEAIKKANRKKKERNLDNVEFKTGDMRNPMPEVFDAIVNLFTTFGYFAEDDENAQVLNAVQKMLKWEGIFIIDYMNSDRVRNTFIPEEEGKFRNISYKIRRYIEKEAIHKEITFQGGELRETRKYTERVKLYDLEWFLEAFDHRNFKVEKILGDYRGNSFNPDTSPRLLMMVRKL